MGNTFDKIAQTVKKVKAAVVKRILDIPDTIKATVDSYNRLKNAYIRMEIRKKELEEKIMTYARKKQDTEAYTGDFSKSFTLVTDKSETTYVSCDDFTVNQETENIKALKELFDLKDYKNLFTVERKIKLNEDVFNDENLQDQLIIA